MDVRVLDDPAAACAELLVQAAGDGLNICLTGGSTPRIAYERAAAAGTDWSRATLWFGDERCVPPDDDDSNYRLAKESLIDRLTGEQPAVKRMRGESGPHAGAEDYERVLREALGQEMPRLDLMLLGLGPDAHVASLFPGQETLEVQDRSCVGVDRAGHEPYVPRISLTLPAINGSRHVVFLVAGEGKAEAVARAFDSDEPDPQAPGSLVRPDSGRMTLLLDGAAASRLRRAA
jgi:6-phosphogluconolactonase